jgi:hypothetical protein
MPVVQAAARTADAIEPATRRWALELSATAALLAVFVASLLQVAARSYNPFIYFRF